MNKIIVQYFMKFKEVPPIVYTVNENDERYLQLVKKSIEKNKPLSEDDFKQVFVTESNILI